MILAFRRRFVARAREIDRLHLLFYELIGMEPPVDFRSVAGPLVAPDPDGGGRGG